jgi:tetratricopeptide (TPR) repeat protein
MVFRACAGANTSAELPPCVQEDALFRAAAAHLADGKELLAAGKPQEAKEAFDTVLIIAPRRYTLAMQSLLGRREANEALGRLREAAADSQQEFLWGRGIRWPGWYIIAAIVFRNEIVRGF